MKYPKSLFNYTIAIAIISNWFSCSEQSTQEIIPQLLISEICYDAADSTIAEFIEIWNPTDQSVKIANIKINGEVDFEFLNNTQDLAPNERITIYRDPVQFAKHHPGIAAYGPYNGSLSNSEGELELETQSGNTIFELKYENQNPWPLAPAGLGYCLTLVDSSLSKFAEGWSAGTAHKGTPNTEDQPLIQKLLINEIMALDSNGGSWIELFNNSAEEIDLSNYGIYESVNSSQFVSMPNISLLPNQYLVISNENTNHSNKINSLNFDINGDHLYLIEKVNDHYTGQIIDFKYEALALGQSAGASVANKSIAFSLSNPTPGEANSSFNSLGLVISEINYHPTEDGFEFVEFQNQSESDIILYKDSLAIQKMKTKGFDVEVNSSLVLSPNEKLIAIPEEILISDFTSKYPGSSQSKIIQYSGKISNSGEELRVYIPGRLIAKEDFSFESSNILSDLVIYRDFWYEATDGDGHSLHRTSSSLGVNKGDWSSLAPTPGE